MKTVFLTLITVFNVGCATLAPKSVEIVGPREEARRFLRLRRGGPINGGWYVHDWRNDCAPSIARHRARSNELIDFSHWRDWYRQSHWEETRWWNRRDWNAHYHHWLARNNWRRGDASSVNDGRSSWNSKREWSDSHADKDQWQYWDAWHDRHGLNNWSRWDDRDELSSDSSRTYASVERQWLSRQSWESRKQWLTRMSWWYQQDSHTRRNWLDRHQNWWRRGWARGWRGNQWGIAWPWLEARFATPSTSHPYWWGGVGSSWRGDPTTNWRGGSTPNWRGDPTPNWPSPPHIPNQADEEGCKES